MLYLNFSLSETDSVPCPSDKLMVPDFTTRDCEYCWRFLFSRMINQPLAMRIFTRMFQDYYALQHNSWHAKIPTTAYVTFSANSVKGFPKHASMYFRAHSSQLLFLKLIVTHCDLALKCYEVECLQWHSPQLMISQLGDILNCACNILSPPFQCKLFNKF